MFILFQYFLGRVIYDCRDMEKLIESEASSIDFTIVRPCILTPTSKTDVIGENDKKGRVFNPPTDSRKLLLWKGLLLLSRRKNLLVYPTFM